MQENTENGCRQRFGRIFLLKVYPDPNGFHSEMCMIRVMKELEPGHGLGFLTIDQVSCYFGSV